jgi:hypothetical protein
VATGPTPRPVIIDGVVPGRASRWVIGLAVTGVLAVLSLQSLADNRVGFAERATDERNAVTYQAYTGRGEARVVELVGGSFAPPARRQRMAVELTTAGGERIATELDLHRIFMPLAPGEEFEAAYDPAHPERVAHRLEVRMLAADPRSLERRLAGPAEGGDGPAPPSYRPAIVAGGLALLVLGATSIRGTRRPRARR